MASSSTAQRRVAVAISGGVDSSVAAYLLKQHCNNLIGLHMQNWSAADEDTPQTECMEADSRDAQAVCQHLNIPLHHASFAAEYWTGVFEPFVEGLASGKTPNPDVGCNSIVKFGAMKEYARQKLGIETIATGHYARLWNRDKSIPQSVEESCSVDEIDWLSSWGSALSPLLLAAKDRSKDQSYFLAGVKGRAFENVLFPLGDLYKSSNDDNSSTVRDIAQEAQLPTARKRESMGICFVGKRNFGNFIHQYLPEPPRPGHFVDVNTGEAVGQHEGSLLYTIGQGAKISGASERYFVVGRGRKDTELLVCRGTHHPALYSDTLFIKNIHWIGDSIPPPLSSTGRMRAKCRIRHLQPLVECEISGNHVDGFTAMFDRPVRAITLGQLAALYVGNDGLVCLGGGAIWERGASYHDRGMDLPTELHPAGHNDLSLRNQQCT